MAFFGNKRKDFSIQPPRQQVDGTPFFVTDSANIDFTLANLNLTANLTTTGITAGTYGDATHIPILTLDSYGRVTGVSTTTFSAAGILLQTNTVTNATQTILNLVNGTDISIVDDTLGNITISYTGTGGSAVWGSITGTLTSQTDLITYLSTNYQPIGSYQPQLNGTGFVKAAGTTISYDNNTYYLASNPSNFITASALTPYLTITSAAATYEPIITAGTISQYWRGDKTWQTFPTIPTVGTWGALNYPAWTTGTPFVKMTAAGTFALDTNTYLTTISGLNISLLTNDSGYITSSALTGYVPNTRTLTINGTTYDLSADRSWTIPTFTSPLTTKGDIYVRNGSADTRLGVGSDTYVLIADSTTSTGLKWGSNTTPPASGYYFAISDSTTQDNPTANIPRAVKFNTTDLANGFSLQTETAVFTGTINNGGAGAGTILNVTGVTSGTLKVGMVLTGGSITAGTFISAFTSGTGGIGTYVVSISQNRTSATYTGTMTSQIVVAHTGIYNIQFSSQMDKTDAGVDYVNFWLRRNGADVTASSGVVSLQGNSPAYMMAAWNYLIELIENDVIELYWGSADVGMSILAETAQTSPFAHPSIQSTILTITQQSGILAGTGITAINSLTASAQTLSSTDLNISSSVATHTFSIANNAVTYAKMQAISAVSKLLGSSSTTTPVQEITPTKSINILTTNLELVNDQTSPAYPGVYGIDSAGAKNWRSDASVRGNIPLLNMQESYPVGTNQTGILYVASVSKLYVCNLSGSTVNIFDTTTGVLLSTIAVTNAYKPFYIASINEVWVTSTTLLTINRISATLNSSLGTIIGATIFGTEAIEYSSTKVFICCGNATGTIMLINPSTLLVTSTIALNVPASPQGMVLNTNVASSQYDKIIVSASAGVAILNPSTNAITTTVVNPSSSISTGTKIRYITSTNQYVLSSFGNNSIVVLDIASATTFTLNSTIRNLPGILDVGLDETSGYIFTAFTGLTSASQLFISLIDLTSKKVKITIGTNVLCGSASTSGYLAMDTPNTRFFICGRSSNTNVATTIKYL